MQSRTDSLAVSSSCFQEPEDLYYLSSLLFRFVARRWVVLQSIDKVSSSIEAFFATQFHSFLEYLDTYRKKVNVLGIAESVSNSESVYRSKILGRLTQRFSFAWKQLLLNVVVLLAKETRDLMKYLENALLCIC